jgi:hypothetical protein
MIRAIVRDGRIQPIDPLPATWEDGQELEVEAATAEMDDIDDAIREIKRRAREIGEDDWQRMESALAEADEQAKAIVRRQMGLP